MTSRFSLSRLRQRDWAIIFIVLSVVAAGLWYWFMYRPTQETITQLEDEIARLDTQIERGEAARRNLPALRLAVAELEQDRREFLAELPTESDVADLLDSLRLSASDADVIVNSLGQGGGGENIQDVRPIGFSMATSGTFVETMEFLSTLETLQRFTKINQVQLSVSEQVDDPPLNANFGFTVYVFTGDDPGESEVRP
ncbi:MAG: type 4a pilus biogenesis protein PilO [Trueperaceae bacterium]|nr:type 4a pilus biogenesis protein PilO [Trueperaceae bacterium]